MTSTLESLNATMTRRLPPRTVGLLGFLLTAAALLSYYHVRFGLDVAPASSGDEPAYDSIGWELSQGNGYQRNLSKPEFRKPYELSEANRRGFQPSPEDRIPDTTRPPLFPAVLSVLNRSFGRQFWAVRVWNVLCLATVCGLACHFVAARYGTLPATLVIPLFVLVDVRTRLYGRAILTEATTTLLVTLLCLSLMKVVDDSSRSAASRVRWFLSSCLCLILGIYARTNLLLWAPVIGILLASAVYRILPRRRLLNAAVTFIIFANLIVVGYLPWMIRNISVTGDFLPLGTQGAMQMSAAYGDAVWESRGVWPNLAARGFFEDVETSELTPMQTRIAKARYSRQTARRWIAAHPAKALMLFPLKVSQSFRPRTISEGVILALSIVGLFAFAGTPEQPVFLALIAACMLGIGLTWSVEGRFLVPLLFVWHTTAAIGLWWLVGRIAGASTPTTLGDESPHR